MLPGSFRSRGADTARSAGRDASGGPEPASERPKVRPEAPRRRPPGAGLHGLRPPDWLTVAVGRVGAVALLLFALGTMPWWSGRDPALTILRAGSAEREISPEALDAVRDRLGLDDGALALFTRWLGGLSRGDLGTSWVSGRPIAAGLWADLGVSLTLMSGALAVALTLAALLVLPALRAGALGRGRAGTGFTAAFLTAVPEFLIGSVLLVVVAVWLGWLPPYGWDGPANMVLPALAMGVPAGGLLARLVDDALAGAFGEQWGQTWRAFRFRRRVMARGGLTRALPALLPQFALVVVALVGGAVTVETLFAVPGVGRAAVGAAISQDLPVLQAYVLALLLVGAVAGGLAEAVQFLMIGPALRGAALTGAPPPPPGRRGPRTAVPAAVAVVLGAVIVAGLLRDPEAVDTSMRLAAPSWDLPFGADALGRDVLARVGHGAARTIATAAAVTAVVLVAGLLLGLLPALSRGPVEVVNAMPPIIAGLVTAAALGPSAFGAAVAVSITSWAPLAAHTAALVREQMATGYVESARTLGASTWWIYRTQVLPNVVPSVARHAMVRLSGIALALASLSFLGLGARPPTPEWGLVLAEGMGYVERAPWAALAPAGALALLGVLAVTLSTLPPKSARG
ncbi:ABC transporter permease subunit [Actinorugispora endophytica]|uniref:Peptide/nickel transport system permease protein n=1 Tax=Actinorugispora endophytica TaxID=1605990 RepID=A0A4R6UXR4_9ACTN|nr:ABC transporter permease subunit [Actinorugispora endophytica]TDQ52257.1 peptide/nickel transport system permease protein [Actinorugispora endophytica]